MHVRRIAKGLDVGLPRVGAEGSRRCAPVMKRVIDDGVRRGQDQAFRKGLRLGEQRPWPEGCDPMVRELPHVQSRDDVEHCESFHPIRVVEREAIGDAAAPIVPSDMEPLEAERSHRHDHVFGHHALGIGGVIGTGGRAAASSVAAQIGADHREVLREQGRHRLPHPMRFRKAVQEKQARSDPSRRRWMQVSLASISTVSASIGRPGARVRVFELHRDNLRRAHPIAGCDPAQGVIQGLRRRLIVVRRQPPLGGPVRDDLIRQDLDAAEAPLRVGSAGERHCTRSVGPRPGVRDEGKRHLVDPRRKLDPERLALPEASVLPITVDANGRVSLNAPLSCARPSLKAEVAGDSLGLAPAGDGLDQREHHRHGGGDAGRGHDAPVDDQSPVGDVADGVLLSQFIEIVPVGGRPLAVEEAGGGDNLGSSAHRDDVAPLAAWLLSQRGPPDRRRGSSRGR